jgi:peptide/nickel transport system ATP-binding protein
MLSGSIAFDGRVLPVTGIPRLRQSQRLPVSMIFQDPATSLNPVRTVGAQIAEVLIHGRGFDRRSAETEAISLLTKVGIPDPAGRMRSYPHELSGGMNQRIMIAMALAAAPQVLIADEPTTALDVTVQAQICALLRQLVAETGLAVIFISHDLDLVAQFCDRVAVMYAGSLIEVQSSAEIGRRPRHPYTRALLAAIPGHRPPLSRLGDIPGEIRTHLAPPAECAFRPRCERSIDRCAAASPALHREARGEFACFNPL